jgi:malate synthase
MTVPFMAAYATELVSVCHRRGAHAIGGMSAFIPNRRDPEVTERALAGVRADKRREAGLGYDGTWVAHPDLVDVATEELTAVLGARPNQLEVQVPGQDLGALLDTRVEGASITLRGVRTNVSVALQYIAAWLAGRGAVAIFDLMEDAATAEISRSQLWQWIQLEAVTAEGTPITAALVDEQIDSVVAELVDGGGDAAALNDAAAILRRVSLADDLPEFLTTLAAEQLS